MSKDKAPVIIRCANRKCKHLVIDPPESGLIAFDNITDNGHAQSPIFLHPECNSWQRRFVAPYRVIWSRKHQKFVVNVTLLNGEVLFNLCDIDLPFARKRKAA